MKDLAGQVAIVTGGGRGIGRAIALRLAQDGADVVVADVNVAAAESVAAEARGLGRKAIACHVDVSRKSDVQGRWLRGFCATLDM